MSRLEELIAELCPDGVEYQELGKIAVCQKTKNKAHITEVAYSITQRGLVPTSDYFGEKTKITSSDTSGYYLVYKDWFVYSPSRIDVGSINYLREDGPVIVSPLDVVFSVEATVIRPGFLLIYLTSHTGMFQILSHRQGIEGTGRKTLPFSEFAKIKVPVPPVAVQDEVLCMLGNFTSLISELTAELTARKKQYEYYRDKLLNFDVLGGGTSDVVWRTLGEIATDIYRGAGITRNQVTEQGIPCVRYGEIYTTYNVWFDMCVSHTDEDTILNKKYFEHGDVLFAITGESIEDIAKSCVYLGHDRCLAGGDIVVMKHDLNPKYLGYVLSTTAAQKQKSKGKVKSKVVHSSVPAISQIIIPIPPLKEQERIAAILDHFDALCNDLTSGLPAEIEARQRQYEYYRDKLLSFPEK